VFFSTSFDVVKILINVTAVDLAYKVIVYANFLFVAYPLIYML
jgi:hypothetical protein